jgi:small GTP-binding protein
VSYYRYSKGALIVYDVTDKDSFEKVKKWQSELEKYLPGAPIMIAGNKCDMVNKNVDEEMATAYARSVGAEHFPTSAKSGHNVKEVFT